MPAAVPSSPGSGDGLSGVFTDAEAPWDAGVHGDVWWVRLVLGVVAVTFGALVLLWPQATVAVVAVLFGLNLLFDGALRVVQAIVSVGGGGGVRVLYGLAGAFSIVIGVLCLRNVTQTVAVLVVLVGLSWLLAGVFELLAVLSSGPPSQWSALDLGVGVVALVAGVVVLVYPGLTLGALVVLLGVSLVVYGVASVVNAIRLRTARAT